MFWYFFFFFLGFIFGAFAFMVLSIIFSPTPFATSSQSD